MSYFKVTLTAEASSESQARAMADLLAAMATRVHPEPHIEITKWDENHNGEYLVRTVSLKKETR